jgi:transcriptional regulator with XRE-family HTH domain
MNGQICTSSSFEIWRNNLIELKNKVNMSCKQIADKENLAEKSVRRVFTGEAKNPGVDLIRRIIHALGGSWSEIFADSTSVIGTKSMAVLQDENDSLAKENEKILVELNLAITENNVLNNKVASLSSENDLLRMKLEHKEELLAVHKYYMGVIKNG